MSQQLGFDFARVNSFDPATPRAESGSHHFFVANSFPKTAAEPIIASAPDYGRTMADSSSDSDSDSSLFNQQLPFARQSQTSISIGGDDDNNGGDGTGGTGLSQTMADAAVGGSGSSSGGGSDNNDTDSLPLSPKKRPRGQGSKAVGEVDEEAVKRRGESTSACSSSLATNLLVMVERH